MKFLQTFRPVHLVLGVVLACFLSTGTSYSQNFEDMIKLYGPDQVKGYVQPFYDVLGSNINAGHYRSAHIPKFGLTIQVDFIFMGSNINDDMREYSLTLPWGATVNAPTVFGGKPNPASVTDPNPPGLTYPLAEGVHGGSMFPFLTPQLRLGSIFGTEGTLRYFDSGWFSSPAGTPTLKIFGFGIRHSVSQYFDVLPVDVAVGYFYDSIKSEGLTELTSSSFGAQVSKSLALITLYGGIQFESAESKLTYELLTTGIPVGIPTEVTGIESKNKFRFTAGAALELAFLSIFADANFGSVFNFSGGIGFGI